MFHYVFNVRTLFEVMSKVGYLKFFYHSPGPGKEHINDLRLHPWLQNPHVYKIKITAETFCQKLAHSYNNYLWSMF